MPSPLPPKRIRGHKRVCNNNNSNNVFTFLLLLALLSIYWNWTQIYLPLFAIFVCQSIQYATLYDAATLNNHFNCVISFIILSFFSFILYGKFSWTQTQAKNDLSITLEWNGNTLFWFCLCLFVVSRCVLVNQYNNHRKMLISTIPLLVIEWNIYLFKCTITKSSIERAVQVHLSIEDRSFFRCM